MEFENILSEVESRANEILKLCKDSRLKIVSVESCTGGLISANLTDISGSSEVFDRGYVAYSDKAKIDMLNIDRGMMNEHGTISDEIVVELAKAAIKKTPDCEISIAVVGVADSPVEGKASGLIHIASACKDGTILKEKLETHSKDRKLNRYVATKASFDLLIQMILLKSDEFSKADPKSPVKKSSTTTTIGCSRPNCRCSVCTCVDCSCEEMELMVGNLSTALPSISSTSTEFSSIASSRGASSCSVDEETKDDSPERPRPKSVPAKIATHWPTSDQQAATLSHPGESYIFYNSMDEDNKKAMDILASKGPAAAMEFMTTDPKTGKSRGSYAEMRSRFG